MEKNRTGNFSVNTEGLDNLQKRIIGCMGLDYVEGSRNCPDSTPEEEAYQLELEKGNENVLHYPPATTSIAEILNSERDINITNGHINNDDDNLSYADVISMHYGTNEENLVDTPTEEISTNTQKKATPNTYQGNKKQTSNKRGRERIGVQLQEARQKFTEIAESHATALQLFVESSMKHAEAAMLATENEHFRNILEEQRLSIELRRLNMDEDLMKILNNIQRKLDK